MIDSAILSGAVVRALRRQRKLSQEALASAAGMSQRHLSFIENGRSPATRPALDRLADALELSVQDRTFLIESSGFYMGIAPQESPPRQDMQTLVDELAVPAIVHDYDGTVLAHNAVVRDILVPCDIDITGFAESGSGHRLLRQLQPFIQNWQDFVAVWRRRLFEEAHRTPEPRLRALLELWGPIPDQLEPPPPIRPLIPLVLGTPSFELSFWLATSTLGTPGERSLRRYRLDLFIPADDLTRQRLSGSQSSPRGNSPHVSGDTLQ